MHQAAFAAGEHSASGRVSAASQAERSAKAPPEPDAAPSASGPSERDLRDYYDTGLVRVRLKDTAMAAQQSSPEVRMSAGMT